MHAIHITKCLVDRGVFVPIETAAIWRREHGGRNAITQNDNVGRDLNIFVFL